MMNEIDLTFFEWIMVVVILGSNCGLIIVIWELLLRDWIL